MSVNVVFPEPDDFPAELWRYVDVAKFLDLATTSTLFLARLSDLRGNDPHEGTATVHDVENISKMLAADSPFSVNELADIVNSSASEIFVSCWHSASESMAMWQIYAGNHGLALVTSPLKLAGALSAATEPLYLGPVSYGQQFPPPALARERFLSWAFRKRYAYSYEREVRLATYLPERREEGERDRGIRVKVDLQSVVDRIVVAPGTPAYVFDGIRRIAEQWMPGTAVSQSDLFDQPQYTIRIPTE